VGLVLKGFDVLNGIDMDTLSIPVPAEAKEEVVETNLFGEVTAATSDSHENKGGKSKAAPARPKKKFKDLWRGKIGDISDIFGTTEADDEA
jgi:hypothetical protein